MLKHCFFLLLIMMLLAGCSGQSATTPTPDPTATQTPIEGDAVQGEALFKAGIENAPPCNSCHLVKEGGFGLSLAPNLANISESAVDRDASLTPEAYIEISILDPEGFVVPGYSVDMYTKYAEHLSEQDVADLVAYLMEL